MSHAINIVLCLLLVQTNATNFQKLNECVKNGKFDDAKIVLDNWGENKDYRIDYITGYMIYKTMYNNEVAGKGIKYIKKGIKKFPDHYEMRSGLLWALKEMCQLDEYLIELEDALKYVTNNKLEKVYWNNNEFIPNPHEFVIEKVQGSFNDIISSNEIFSNKQFMYKCVDLMIQYFPKHKYGYADKGYIYLVNNDY